MPQRIALFGGSFDPIHLGHLIIARSVVERLDLDRIIFLPSATPPHKMAAVLASPQHRAAMVRLAIADEPIFDFSDYDLLRDGPTYTVETIAHFRADLGADAELYWLIGADSLPELTTWYRARDLIDSCHIVTAARPGWERIDFNALRPHFNDNQIARLEADILETPRIDISSTNIRSRAAAGKSVRFLVPESVHQYIVEHDLYRAT
ncbi:MAG TPA: nicotinate-nucleotide adenylyltransferase [Phycisphaerae bacterium]|nr:nicotinate-nucleotide adenylyltransferase [Phycisphaerae bacterium]